MTAQSQNTEEKRLDSFALQAVKSPKIRENHESSPVDTLKIDVWQDTARIELENIYKNLQSQDNTKLLGEYRINTSLKGHFHETLPSNDCHCSWPRHTHTCG